MENKQKKQYDVPKCFRCKVKQAVNHGFCDDCMQEAYALPCDMALDHLHSCKDCQREIMLNGENI